MSCYRYSFHVLGGIAAVVFVWQGLRMNKRDYTSATEVASYAYCPEAWRLEHGLKLKPGNDQARARGERVHERWQKTERRSGWLIRVAGVCFLVLLLLWMFL
jgi:hypothetical protein